MRHTLICLAAGGLLLASCGEKKAETAINKTDVIPVKVLATQAEQMPETIEVTGSFTTDDETYLSFKTGGIISRITVKEGDRVRKGQVLATLNLTEVNATVAQYKLGLEKAERDYNRVKNLYNDSVATLEQLQNAKTGYDVARQQLTAAEFNLSHSTLTADKDGYVLKKLASEGQQAGPGTPILLVNGAGSGVWLLRATVSDRQWAAVQMKDEATVTVSTDEGKRYNGSVTRRSEGVDPMSGALTVDIAMKNTPERIAAGMFGRAVIKTKAVAGAAEGIVTVPYEAIIDGDGQTGYVFTTSDNATAHKKKITIGALLKDRAVISSGLEGAGAVIISGSAYLTDNSKIKVLP